MSKTSIKSKSAGIETLKRFFSHTSADEVSIEEAFQAAGRPIEKPEANKAWLSNKLTTLKYHNLLSVNYAYDSGRRKLDKLRLTLEGKRALGRIEESSHDNNEVKTNGSTSIADIMKTVAQLRKSYPEFDITFDIKLKNVG
jgi:hypothetical protein